MSCPGNKTILEEQYAPVQGECTSAIVEDTQAAASCFSCVAYFLLAACFVTGESGRARCNLSNSSLAEQRCELMHVLSLIGNLI